MQTLVGNFVYAQLQDVLSWSSILLATAIGFTTWLIYIQVVRPYRSPLYKIPGYPYQPFSINGTMGTLTKGQAMEAGIKSIREYGPIVRYYFYFGGERIMIADPKMMKHVLVTNSSNYIKPKDRMRSFRKVFGQGLVTSEAPVHTVHKKLMSPAFNQASINKMLEVFVEKTDKLVSLWETRLKPGESTDIAIHDDMAKLTLDIIGKTAFGYEFDALDNTENKVTQAVHKILSGQELNWKMALPFYFYLPLEEVYLYKRNIKYMEETIYEIIEQKKQALKENKDIASVSKDVLGMMMLARDEKTGQGLTDTELRDQVITLMLAGHETTAVAMAWCLLLLSQHPTIQQRAREEAQSVAPEGTTITRETLDKLDYITCVAKEVLRLKPPVPLTLRMAVKDDTLGGYEIPKGTILLICIGAMMRTSEKFSDPNTFNPDRFNSGEGQDLYAFLPFLVGSRMCLGYKFALQEMQVIITSLLRRFEFKQIPGTEYKRKQRITMRPDPSLHLLVTPAK